MLGSYDGKRILGFDTASEAAPRPRLVSLRAIVHPFAIRP
jgi:hypothetical protein